MQATVTNGEIKEHKIDWTIHFILKQKINYKKNCKQVNKSKPKQ